ncbi:MAG: zinc ribbon domain-containing protein [Candidatus Aminicenantes bacterium]|nr:MAG: zinc ribbon domain-containing protein [Candidatus Aminicenantes bacterium]
MPIYEYKCQECGNVTEVFVRSFNQEIDFSCSHCGSKNLHKIFSTPSSVRIGNSSSKGSTCCGKDERCETPPCSDGSICRRD